MHAELLPERRLRTPGCGPACVVVKAMLPGVFGRSELLLCDPETHEDYGRWQANPRAFLGRHTVVSGPLAVNLSSLDVSVNGQAIVLSATELRVLCVLARHVGAAVHPDDLLSLAWGAEYRGARHLLRVTMARLRRKLREAGGLIVTLIGSGYRLQGLPPGAPAPERGARDDVAPCKGWAKGWDCCRNCGSSASRHRAHGFCCRQTCRRAVRTIMRKETSHV